MATVLNSLAKNDASGKATAALVSDTDGVIGIVVGGAGTSGTAQIAINGQAICNFDGTAVVGHFVTISSTTAGDCHDTGAATRWTTAQTIGRVLTGGTTATVALGLNGAGGGAASGSTGYVQFNNSGAFLGTSNLFWDNTNNRLGIGSPAPTVGLDLSQENRCDCAASRYHRYASDLQRRRQWRAALQQHHSGGRSLRQRRMGLRRRGRRAVARQLFERDAG